MKPEPQDALRTSAGKWEVSLGFQRVLLLILLVLVGLHFFLTTANKHDGALTKISEPALAAELRSFDYSAMELAFAAMPLDDDQRLVIDANTQVNLSNAAEHLIATQLVTGQSPTKPSNEVLDRVALLLTKQMPARAAAQVDDIFRRYVSYHFNSLSLRQGHEQPHSLEEEIEHFELLSALQDRELGLQLSEALFGQHRRLARLMFASRRLDQDQSLSPAERQARMRELQNRIYGGDDAQQ